MCEMAHFAFCVLLNNGTLQQGFLFPCCSPNHFQVLMETSVKVKTAK